MRLTLVIYSITSGGAERVMSILANYWVAKDWEITLLTFDDGSVPVFYDLDSRIHQLPLAIAARSSNPIQALQHNWHRIQKLRSAIVASHPDAVLSFTDTVNVLVLLAMRGLKIPVVVSERNDPGNFPIGRIWSQLRRWSYSFADRIVVQTQRALDYFPPQIQARSDIIPNPVLLPSHILPHPTAEGLLGDRCEFLNSAIREGSEKPLERRSLIAMGRLEPQKGFDLLLQAFANLKNEYPDWTLTILGEGTLRSDLESLCKKLGLGDRVNLPGRIKNPYPVLKQADIFIMSSRFEGFPNALCEAMACGLPVISTDCPSGPREIIRSEIDGLLIPNEDLSALTAAMKRLMTHADERQRLSVNALKITERFALDKIMHRWENLLDQVVQEKLCSSISNRK
jgi:GalNAc-alpha-(1->4)-GalNAc-alpha-(1->3)-diNAcBac-PP-undecaprenol alpha-1,4-N-acetyl-D-galactosaminyltransferase